MVVFPYLILIDYMFYVFYVGIQQKRNRFYVYGVQIEKISRARLNDLKAPGHPCPADSLANLVSWS